MKHILLTSVISAVLCAPAAAQEDNGKSLMEQGAELFFEGLRKEMEPALDELLDLADEFGPAMQSFLQEMGPALVELGAEIKDWSAYEVPEILPNGDIIIRKKPDEDSPTPNEQDEEAPEGATDI
ncbi:hypothetical protein [uncultured Ruegeria sp.]|uniref:hypothetical protein n=1 Tax=uncultured Ruegeria sp. TaxID=259304 RepID=UPI00262A3105|nr:hypothetical protein [uncultured Ruegeria sp.]